MRDVDADTAEAAARTAIALLPGLKEAFIKKTPQERRATLLARVKKMPAVKVKRAVLRFLAAGKKGKWILTKAAGQ
ncbi:MAG: hypothetical protein ACOYOU_15170 [Kiritimatiellia bacterium]